MIVKNSDLVKVFGMLIDALSKSDTYQMNKINNDEFELLYDFYWTPPINERYALENTTDWHVGSISHDLERITACLHYNEPMIDHFRYLGNILIAIADTISYQVSQGDGVGLWSAIEGNEKD